MSCPFYKNCTHVDCNKEICPRKYKLGKLFDLALLTEKQKEKIEIRIDSDNTDYAEFTRLKNISLDIVNFVNNGNNLYLHSSQCGNGKTTFAVRLIQAYLNKIWPTTDLVCRALFINVPLFLKQLKANISEKNEYITFINENILKADLVVWDDIAAKNGTEFELDTLLSLIDTRLNAGKSNIFTSNKNKTEMYPIIGERLTSRVCNMSIDIELHGKDKRCLMVSKEY